MKEKRPGEEPKKYEPEIVEMAKGAVAELVRKEYDKDSIWRFAKAAKSWCERGSKEFLMWEFVVRQMEPQS